MLVYGQEKYSSANSLEGSIAFMIEQIINRVNVCTPVEIVAVHTEGPFGVVGTVDVKPLIDQQTVLGEAVEHTTIYGIPYIRIQGGTSAIIADPVVGDLGICIFADRDISSFKETGREGVPPTFRTYDMADGIYIGGWNRNTAPVQYVAVNAEGITEQAGPGGEITQEALNILTTVTGLWNQILHNVTVQADSFTITVPEFAVQGNLSVSGIVHCTWQGNLIDIAYGGTGSNLSSSGGPNMVLAQLSPGAAVTVVPISELSPGDEYTNTNPTPVTIGGIPAGSTFMLQTMTQMWNALLYPYQAPSFNSFYINTQTSPLEVGDTSLANPVFEWSLLNAGNVDPSSVTIKDLTAAVTLVTGASNIPPYTATYAGITKTTATSEVFQISAENTQSVVFTRTYSITWQWRVHYGDSASTSLSSSDIVALSGGLQGGFAGTYSFPAAAGEYKIFAYPTSMGTAASFVDTGTGFAVPFNTPYVVTVTNAHGVVTNYNVHQSTYQLGGAVNIAIS